VGLLASTTQDAIAAGNKIRQRWTILVPVVAGSSTFTENVIHDDDGDQRTVIDAGRRRNTAYNVSIVVPGEMSASSYEFVVDNSSGRFYSDVVDGYFYSNWGGLMYKADPRECRVKHEVFVDVGGSWVELPCSPWIGQITDVIYEDTYSADGTPQPVSATIISEGLLGTILRQPWTSDHTHEDNALASYTPSGMVVSSLDRGWYMSGYTYYVWAQCITTVACDSTLKCVERDGLVFTTHTATTTATTTHQIEFNLGAEFDQCDLTWNLDGGASFNVTLKHPELYMVYRSEPGKERPW